MTRCFPSFTCISRSSCYRKQMSQSETILCRHCADFLVLLRIKTQYLERWGGGVWSPGAPWFFLRPCTGLNAAKASGNISFQQEGVHFLLNGTQVHWSEPTEPRDRWGLTVKHPPSPSYQRTEECDVSCRDVLVTLLRLTPSIYYLAAE